MSLLKRAGNDAINANGFYTTGTPSDESITYKGSNWYWAVCAVMTVSTLAFIGLSARKSRSHRVFHYITAAITMTAAIAYFSMASNLGWTSVNVEFVRSGETGPTREIFYVRYIDWFITTPLLLLDLLLTAGIPRATIAWVIFLDEVMIVTGLVGALVASSYKWGYFTIGCVALFFIVWVLVFEARTNANKLGKDVGRVFLICGSLTTVLWCLYPIAWGVCEGGNILSPDAEAGFYGALDFFAKPVFGALLIWGHKDIEPSRLGIHIREYTAGDDVYKHEKPIGHSNGVTSNPTTAAPAPTAEHTV